MSKQEDILIVGGYGAVGVQIAAELAPDYAGLVIVAGRHLEKAEQIAAEIGFGVRGRQIDVDDPVSIEAALKNVAVIVSCIDQREPHLFQAAIAHGLAYTDITPHLMTRRPTAAMKSKATATGARIILGAGLAPGISSMFARLGADRVAAVDSVESNVLLSAGDVYGPASSSYLLEEFSLPFSTLIAGQVKAFKPLVGATSIHFPQPLGWRKAYRFPFSDQVFFPETLGAHTSITRLALNPPWVGSVLSLLLRLGLPALMKRRAGGQERFQKFNTWLKQKYAGIDWYGLVVAVRGSRGLVRVSLVGHGQARGTAIGAALLARALIEQEVECAGIWLAEQVVPSEWFFKRLTEHGLVPIVEAELHPIST